MCVVVFDVNTKAFNDAYIIAIRGRYRKACDTGDWKEFYPPLGSKVQTPDIKEPGSYILQLQTQDSNGLWSKWSDAQAFEINVNCNAVWKDTGNKGCSSEQYFYVPSPEGKWRFKEQQNTNPRSISYNQTIWVRIPMEDGICDPTKGPGICKKPDYQKTGRIVCSIDENTFMSGPSDWSGEMYCFDEYKDFNDHSDSAGSFKYERTEGECTACIGACDTSISKVPNWVETAKKWSIDPNSFVEWDGSNPDCQSRYRFIEYTQQNEHIKYGAEMYGMKKYKRDTDTSADVIKKVGSVPVETGVEKWHWSPDHNTIGTANTENRPLVYLFKEVRETNPCMPQGTRWEISTECRYETLVEDGREYRSSNADRYVEDAEGQYCFVKYANKNAFAEDCSEYSMKPKPGGCDQRPPKPTPQPEYTDCRTTEKFYTSNNANPDEGGITWVEGQPKKYCWYKCYDTVINTAKYIWKSCGVETIDTEPQWGDCDTLETKKSGSATDHNAPISDLNGYKYCWKKQCQKNPHYRGSETTRWVRFESCDEGAVTPKWSNCEIIYSENPDRVVEISQSYIDRNKCVGYTKYAFECCVNSNTAYTGDQLRYTRKSDDDVMIDGASLDKQRADSNDYYSEQNASRIDANDFRSSNDETKTRYIYYKFRDRNGCVGDWYEKTDRKVDGVETWEDTGETICLEMDSSKVGKVFTSLDELKRN